MEVIHNLYISAVSHPEGTKQKWSKSSGKFASTPLEDLSWRGLIRRVFQPLQHVNCSRGQKNFPSPDALIPHIERSLSKDKDSVTFSARTTLDRSTSLHCSVVTRVKKKILQRNTLQRILPKLRKKVSMSSTRSFGEWTSNYRLLQRYGVLRRM